MLNSILLIRDSLSNIDCCNKIEIPSKVINEIGSSQKYLNENEKDFENSLEEALDLINEREKDLSDFIKISL